jgi:hypothetical protein
MPQGVRLVADGTNRNHAQAVADGFQSAGLQLVQCGSRSLWEYPSGGSGQGTPVDVGRFRFTYVSVYWDGVGVHVSMAGPSLPNTSWGCSELLGALGVKFGSRANVDMVSGIAV